MNKGAILLISMINFCTNTMVYPATTIEKTFEAKLIQQNTPKYKNRDDNYKELMKKVEKLKQEKEKQRKIEEERKKKELEEKQKVNNQNKENKENAYSRGENAQKINLTLSFYGSGEDENGVGMGNITASGAKLHYGVVASNNFKLKTKIYIDKLGDTFTVLDTGSPKHLRQLSDGSIKIDVYVPKLGNESVGQYKRRIMNMGIVKTVGWVVK